MLSHGGPGEQKPPPHHIQLSSSSSKGQHPHAHLLPFIDSPSCLSFMPLAMPGPQLGLSSDSSRSFPTTATKIQATWRGFHWRQKFLRVKRSGVGAQRSSGGPGSRGGMGHHGEKIKISHLWYLQPSVSSHGGVAHWAGGRQLRGSGQLKRSVGECCGARRGNCQSRWEYGSVVSFSPSLCLTCHLQTYSWLHLAPCTPLP